MRIVQFWMLFHWKNNTKQRQKTFPLCGKKVLSIFPFFASLCLVQTVLQLGIMKTTLPYRIPFSLHCVVKTHAELFTHRKHTMSADESDSLPHELYNSSSCCCGWRCFHMWARKKSFFFETFMFMAFAIIIKSIASNMHVEGDQQQPCVWVGEFNMKMYTERARHVEVKIKRVFFLQLIIHASLFPPYANIFTQITHVCH